MIQRLSPARAVLVVVGLCGSVQGVAAASSDAFSVLLAMAQKARATCLEQGYPTTVTAVGLDGQAIVVLRSDGAPIHSIENSFDKAYTIMTLGALEQSESMTALAAKYKQQPAITYGLPADPLPHVAFGLGSVLVRLNGRPVAGLGVSGSVNGVIDESCAAKGAEVGGH